MENKKQNQTQDKKKKRKILLATLIPVGVLAATAAIVTPTVIACNKGHNNGVVITGGASYDATSSYIVKGENSTIVLKADAGKTIKDVKKVCVDGKELTKETDYKFESNTITIFAAAMTSTNITIEVETETTPVSTYEFDITDKGLVSLKWDDDHKEQWTKTDPIKIPEKVNNITVTGVSKFGFCHFDQSTYSKTPCKATSIAFEKPENIVSIGDYAFGQTDITSFEVPKNVTVINNSTFFGCSKLNNVLLPEGVTLIDEYAFEDCSSLASITLPSTLQKIKTMSFKNSGLLSITIPASVSLIGRKAFESCNKLTSVTFSDDSKTWIQTGGKDTITIIDSSANATNLKNCSETPTGSNWGYTGIKVAEAVLVYTPIDETTCSVKATGTLPTTMSSIEIPSTVTIDGKTYTVVTIESEGFKNQTNISSIKFPSTLTKIGSNAFSGCTNLATAEFTNTMKKWNFEDQSDENFVQVDDAITNATNLNTDKASNTWVCNTQNKLYFAGDMTTFSIQSMTKENEWLFNYTFTADNTEYNFKVLFINSWSYDCLHLYEKYKAQSSEATLELNGSADSKISGLTVGSSYTIHIDMENQQVWATKQ